MKKEKDKKQDRPKKAHALSLFIFIHTFKKDFLHPRRFRCCLRRRVTMLFSTAASSSSSTPFCLLCLLLLLCSSPLLCEERTRARLRLFVRVLSSRPVRVRDEKTYVQRRGPAVVHDEHVRLKRGELSRQWVTQRGRDEYCDVFGLFVRVLQRLQLSDVDYERVSFGRHTAVHAVRVLVEVLLVPRPGGA